MPEAVGGTQERHEVKFAAYAIEYNRLEHWLKMHPAGFISPYPDRQVNNVYFDTWEYRAYADNVAGVSERSKLRYRWYGDHALPGAGSLEVKQKRNHFGWKLRYPVAEAPGKANRGWRDIRAALIAQLPMDAQLWLHQNPLPIMINRYKRQYLVTLSGAIRVTIDSNQRIYDQRHGDQVNLTRRAVMQDTLVIEVKFGRSDRQEAVRILENIPLRIGRHSKYINGLRAIAFIN